MDPRKAPRERNASIAKSVLRGSTTKEMAQKHGISIPRVQQIVLEWAKRAHPQSFARMERAGHIGISWMRDHRSEFGV